MTSSIINQPKSVFSIMFLRMRATVFEHVRQSDKSNAPKKAVNQNVGMSDKSKALNSILLNKL